MAYMPKTSLDEVVVSDTQPTNPFVDYWVDTVSGPSVAAATSHNTLLQRDATNAHPTAAITGLDAQLTAITNLNGFRNFIRNGDMGIAQRGNGPWTTTQYCVDGYTMENNGTMSTTRVVQAPGLGSPLVVMAVSGQSVAANYASFWAIIEDVNTLSGQTATISFMAKANSGTPKISLVTWQGFGGGGSPSASVTTAFGSPVTLSTTLTRYSITATVPSVVGKTLGTTTINHSLQIGFHLSAGTSSPYYAATGGIGLQNNTFSITDIQMEAGATATPFEKLPVQQQLAWCQRYFQRWKQPPLRGIVSGTTSASRMGMPFPVQMRVKPSVTLTGILYIWNGVGAVTTTWTTITRDDSTAQVLEIEGTTSGMSAGQGLVVYQDPNAGTIDCSAEI